MGKRLDQSKNNKVMIQESVFEDLKKLKDFEKGRSHSAGTKKKEKKKEELQNIRTRSVSPRPMRPPLNVKLPLKKFYNIYSKIVAQLETLKSLAEHKSNETETLIDLRRQLQRADEFSIRFSRNNLYETKRIFNEIKKMIVSCSLHTLNSNECKFLCKKITVGYQAASQSLQIYINYVKNPSNLELPEKILELVLLVSDLFLCCEQLSFPTTEVFIQNDAIRICNELVSILKSKMTVCEYLVIKQEDFSKKKMNHFLDGGIKFKTLSMYKSKPNIKVKPELPPKKKFGMPCLLGNKSRKVKKKDEKKARITHEIYTQKLNLRQAKNPWHKTLKYESSKGTADCDKSDGTLDKKQLLRKPKFFTPREVRSQDDDIETMVQTIEDDEVVSSRFCPTLDETEEESIASNSVNKTNFRDLLKQVQEAVQELQNSEKKENKLALKKLLHLIQNCSKNQYSPSNSLNVKLFYFKSKDLEEENKKTQKCDDEAGIVEPSLKSEVLNVSSTEQKTKNSCRKTLESRLNVKFKPIKQGKDFGKKKEEAKREKIVLKLPESSVEVFSQYKKSFMDYTINNIMYKETLATKPWELVEKIADRVLFDIIQEIAADFENDVILKRLYLNEFIEVIN